MTVEDAKKLIIKIMPKGNSMSDIQLKGALSMAIISLDRQIPKKPLEPLNNLLTGICPVCGLKFSNNDSYCVKCGQKIAWPK